LQLSITAQGETSNKRLGIAFTATSYTLAGPLGGFHYFDYANSPWALGVLDGTQMITVYQYPNSNPVSYLPHIYGYYTPLTATPAFGCCINGSTRDMSNQQHRTVSISYNILPTTQLTLRYGSNNTSGVYNGTPSYDTFQSPAGYQGNYSNGFQFYIPNANSSSIEGNLSRELDQLYEWDLHSQIHKGSVRISYLSYNSTNNTNQFSGSTPICTNCTFSGEA